MLTPFDSIVMTTVQVLCNRHTRRERTLLAACRVAAACFTKQSAASSTPAADPAPDEAMGALVVQLPKGQDALAKMFVIF